MRVLKWIVGPCARAAQQGKETPIGWTPYYDDMEWAGLEVSQELISFAYEQSDGKKNFESLLPITSAELTR